MKPSRRNWLAFAAAAGVAAAALAPLALILKQALTPDRESFAWPPTFLPQTLTLDNLRAVGGAVEVSHGLLLSAGVAAATVVATLALAAPAAWLAARQPRAGARLDLLMVLARVFPTIAVAVPLAALFVRAGLYNSPSAAGLWLAHVLLGLPIAFLILRAGFRAVPRELEDAARLDGARPGTVFFRITVPLVWPQVATAALLVFLTSWDELTYALLLQVTNRTLPPLLYYLSAYGFPGLASAVAAIMVVPALALIFVVERAFRSGVLAGSER